MLQIARCLFLFIVAAAALAGCRKPPMLRGVKAAPGRVEATVTSLNSGTVRAEQVAELAFGAVGRVEILNVRLGQQVKKGELLAELENKDLFSQRNAAQAEALRQKELLERKASSHAIYDQAVAAYDLARIAYDKTQIRAPYDGIIAELNLEVGQLSQITAIVPKALIRIVDLNPRYVRAELDEVDLPRVRLGMPARIKILAVRRAPFAGRIRMIVPYISTVREQDRTSEFELTVENEGILLPVGASADVEVVLDTREASVAVPARAVSGRSDARCVYRWEAGRLVRTPVEVGLYNYDRVEILRGLRAGEVVVLPSEGVELRDKLAAAVELEPWPS